ncbi:kinase [Achromatium sp. WMS2]|nr:kinase [Achromatium sp. WMS2]
MDSSTQFDQPWLAPAKLNLMLRILGQRPDGYHELQTVFQFIDVYDQLYFRPRKDRRVIRTTNLKYVTPDRDLAVKAARLLQNVTNCKKGINIHIEKRLPIGGGLGGGSSDAATTLIALNKLWQLNLTTAKLAKLGLQLGADVPIFVHGQAAWSEGIGEKLTSITLSEPWYLVLIPDCQVLTKIIFTDSALTRDSNPITIGNFLAGDQRNDCLDVVRRLYPQVARALDWLEDELTRRAVGGHARLTGTGACVFAAFSAEQVAREVLASLPAGIRGLVAKGLNRSPLLMT